MSTVTLDRSNETIEWLEVMYAVRSVPAHTLRLRLSLAQDRTTDARILEVLRKDPVAAVRDAAEKSLNRPAAPTLAERVAQMSEGELIDWLEALYAQPSCPAETLTVRKSLAGGELTSPRIRERLLRDQDASVRLIAAEVEAKSGAVIADRMSGKIARLFA